MMGETEKLPNCAYCHQDFRYGEKVAKFEHDLIHDRPQTCISRLAERLAVTEARLARLDSMVVFRG